MALYVSTEELKQVSKNLADKKNQISEIYNLKLKNIMEESKDAIIASGLDFNDYKQSLGVAFSKIENKLDELSNVLSNQIIPQYENLDAYIGRAFNNEFASEMSAILRELN